MIKTPEVSIRNRARDALVRAEHHVGAPGERLSDVLIDDLRHLESERMPASGDVSPAAYYLRRRRLRLIDSLGIGLRRIEPRWRAIAAFDSSATQRFLETLGIETLVLATVASDRATREALIRSLPQEIAHRVVARLPAANDTVRGMSNVDTSVALQSVVAACRETIAAPPRAGVAAGIGRRVLAREWLHLPSDDRALIARACRTGLPSLLAKTAPIESDSPVAAAWWSMHIDAVLSDARPTAEPMS